MATYVIEGTISELRKEDSTEKNCNIKIKISGSEGYSVKQDKETYNIFCPKDMPKHGKMKLCYIINAGASITVCQTYETILMQASISGKRIRLTIPEDKFPKDKTGKTSSLQVTSVTVLSE